jgi:hypothetical protein
VLKNLTRKNWIKANFHLVIVTKGLSMNKPDDFSAFSVRHNAIFVNLSSLNETAPMGRYTSSNRSSLPVPFPYKVFREFSIFSSRCQYTKLWISSILHRQLRKMFASRPAIYSHPVWAYSKHSLPANSTM